MFARIPIRHLNGLCHRLATSLHAGVDQRKCWEREAGRASGAEKRHFEAILSDVRAGESLTDAFSRTDQFFPPLVHELVSVGESTGALERVFAGLSEHYARVLRLRRLYIAGITWPAIQLVIALFVIGIVILVTGMINEQNKQQSVDMLGLGLAGVSGLIVYLAVVAAIASGLGLIIFAWSRGRLGGSILMRVLVHIPYLGECIRTFALARFAWTLSLVSETSMDVRKALRLAIRGTNSVYYIRHEDEIDQVIARGRPIHEGLRAAGVFPREFVEILETGEESGKIFESLHFLSREYEQRAEAMSGVLTKLASFGTWAIVAAIIIFFIFRIAGFYVSAIQDAASF